MGAADDVVDVLLATALTAGRMVELRLRRMPKSACCCWRTDGVRWRYAQMDLVDSFGDDASHGMWLERMQLELGDASRTVESAVMQTMATTRLETMAVDTCAMSRLPMRSAPSRTHLEGADGIVAYTAHDSFEGKMVAERRMTNGCKRLRVAQRSSNAFGFDGAIVRNMVNTIAMSFDQVPVKSFADLHRCHECVIPASTDREPKVVSVH